MTEPEPIETALVDLTELSLWQACAEAELPQDQIRGIVDRTKKPRYNLGSSGPPGRSD